jgi:predicted nucleic acid-binding protein
VILVDTSVWIDHLRAGDAKLASLLDTGQVLAHPFVTGEIALGQLR